MTPPATSEQPDSPLRIAYYVTSHGFGHAARAAAIMAALLRRRGDIHFDILSTTPPWFFRDSIPDDTKFTCHHRITDVGMVQKNPLEEDLEASLDRLGRFYPLDPSLVASQSAKLARWGTRLVICDIAPLGLAAAKGAGIPSVLVENFTWDWIYDGYRVNEAGLGRFSDYLHGLLQLADHHIQTEPICHRTPSHLITPPVSRLPRTPAHAIRSRLGIDGDTRMVMVTMGGTKADYRFLDRWLIPEGFRLVIPGAAETITARGRLLLLPNHSRFYHPDLIHASDAVIGKVGYSTISEVYHAGTRFGYITRPAFRESGPLVTYIREMMPAMPIAGQDFHRGLWIQRLARLLEIPRTTVSRPNGGDRVATYLLDLLSP